MATEAEELDKAKPRTILGLKVKELSMVDKPAILREFLVVKRQEDNTMGAFDTDDAGQTATDPVIEGMNWKEIDVEKALPIDLRNAIKAVVPWLKKSAGMEGAPKDEIGRVVAFLGKVEGGQYPEPAAKAKKDEDMTDDEKKKKEEEEAAAKAKAEEEEKKKADAAASDDDKKKQDEEDKEEEKKKAATPLNLVIHPDGTTEMMGDVTKGASQFTTQRTEAIKSSVGQLLTLLAKVDADAAKALIDELTKSVLPANVKWTPGTTATPASVKKSVEEAIAPITKALEDLGVKVETIEKARPAPQSEEGDGDTTDAEVKKNKGAWDGLPLTPRG